MKKNVFISAGVSLLLILLAWGWALTGGRKDAAQETLRVGIVVDGDESAPYSYNFLRARQALEAEYGDRVRTFTAYNIPAEASEAAMRDLIDQGCDLIFATSASYGEAAKALAGEFPEIQFCAACCDNADEEPVYANYHTFMGRIAEGRYVSGLVAGMKLKELMEEGTVAAGEARLGYVGAFPTPEVISGFTAFFLGVKSAAPEAVMTVRYTGTWNSYGLELAAANRLLDEGCVILSQHSDTIGPAVACEKRAEEGRQVYHVGYNQSMLDVAPTASLVSTRINWTPYFLAAAEAVLRQEPIERHLDADIHGTDAGAGFDRDWVQMVELNGLNAAPGTEEAVAEAVAALKKGRLRIFQGDYRGADPLDPTDTVDLSRGYAENEASSAPTFHYILDGITVEN